MRLIDADALGVGEANRDVFIVPEYADGWNSAIKMIKNAPTVDAVPVEYGKWLERECDDGDHYGNVTVLYRQGFENCAEQHPVPAWCPRKEKQHET